MLRALQPRASGFRGLALFRCKPAQFRFYSGPNDDGKNIEQQAKDAAASKPRWGSATRDFHREQININRPPKNYQGHGGSMDFDPSDPTSFYAHQKQRPGDRSFSTSRESREEQSQYARAYNTRRPVHAAELTARKPKKPKAEGDVGLEHMLGENPEELEFDREQRRLEEKAVEDEWDEETEIDLENLGLGMDEEDKRARNQEREDKKREDVRNTIRLQNKVVADRFLEEGDEALLDRQTQSMIKSTQSEGMFPDTGHERGQDDMSPRVKALLARRIKDERKFILDLNVAVKTQKQLGRESEGNTPEEIVGRGFEDMSLRQKIRDARMATEAEFQLIGFLTTMEEAQSKRAREQRKMDYRLKIWKQRVQEKYGAKIAARKERSEAVKKALKEERATDPNWFFYQEFGWWVHRRHLEKHQVRVAIQALMKNPSYTNQQRRGALDLMIKTMDQADNTPAEWYENRWLYYKGLVKPEGPQRTSPDYGRDPDFKFPKSYEELIEAVEAEMTYEEKVARFAPPEGEPKYSPYEY